MYFQYFLELVGYKIILLNMFKRVNYLFTDITKWWNKVMKTY